MTPADRKPQIGTERLHGIKNGYGNVVVGMFMRDLFTFSFSLSRW